MAGSQLAYDRLAETLEEIRLQVVALSTIPQLSRSSIEDGAILEYAEGSQVAQYGEQFDGAHAAVSLSGPKPPRPSAPAGINEAPGVVNVYYDGTYCDAAGTPDITIPVPTDYTGTEIHASQDPAFTAETWDTLADAFTSPRGGAKTIALPAGTWYIKLVTRTLSGNKSDPSPAATVTVAAGLTDQDLTELEERFDQDMVELDLALKGNISTAKTEAITEAGTNADQKISTATPGILSTAASEAQNKVDAAKIAIETAIAQGASIIPNGNFEAGDTHWNAAAGRTIVDSASARSGSKVLRISGPDMGAANSYPMSDYVPSGKDRSFYIEYWIRKTGTNDNLIGIYTQTTTTAGGISGIFPTRISSNTIPEGTWTKISGTLKVQVEGIETRFGPHITQPTSNVYEIDDFLVVDVTEAVAAQARADEAHGLAGSAAGTAQSALNAAGTKSAIYYSTSTPSGTGTRAGDVWRQRNAGREIIGEWEWDGDSWEKTTVSGGMVSNFDVGYLTAGAATITDIVAQTIAGRTAAFMNLDVGQLVAGTANITTGVADKFFTNMFATRRLAANQVYVGPGPNPIPDPAFIDATTLAARKARSTGGTAGWTDVPATATSPKGVRRTTTSGGTIFDLWPLPTASAADIPGMIAVEAGDTWKFSIDVETSTSATIIVNMRQGKADGTITPINIPIKSGATASGRRTVVAEYKVPAGVIAITPYVSTAAVGPVLTIYGNAFMGLKADATLVVEGIINGHTVIGARIATADTGPRLEFNGLGSTHRFFGVNTAGETFLDFTEDGAFLKAVLEVDAPLFAQRIVLGPFTVPTSSTTSKDAAGLAFFRAVEPGGEQPAMITSYDGDNVVIEGRRTATSLPGKIYVGPNLMIQAEGDFHLQGTINASGGDFAEMSAFEMRTFPSGFSNAAVIHMNYGGISGREYAGTWYSVLGGVSGDEAWIGLNSGTGDFDIRARRDRPMWLRPNGASSVRVVNTLEIWDPPTSTFSANLGIASNPKDRLYKLGSSGALKVNREPITEEHAWRVLELVPRKWYDRAQLEELLGPDVIDGSDRLHPKIDPALLTGLDLRMHPGLVAEEVHAAGLTEFVDYEDGEPAAVDYDRMWPLILPILRYILERVGYPTTMKVPIKPSPFAGKHPVPPIPPTKTKGRKH